MSELKIEIITIGKELLDGRTVNSNAAFISAHLFRFGYAVERHTTFPDDLQILKEGLKEAQQRSELVIITGGLGPTLDDLTRRVVAEVFNCKLSVNALVATDLQKRFGKELDTLQDQATIPEKAQPLLNSVGTAPGLLFSTNDKIVVCFPGVPEEMQPMFVNTFLPILQKRHPPLHKYIVCLYACFFQESQINPMLKELQTQLPELEIGIYPSYSNVTIMLSSENKASLEYAEKLLKTQLDSFLYTATTGKIEEAIHSWFIQEKKTLVLAESCTGGTMASLLTAIKGASEFFLGSFVTYSSDLKQHILDVPKEILETKGAVSAECVLAMLNGALEKSQADVGLAISGIAGPTSDSSNQKIGTMWAAIQEKGNSPYVFRLQITGDRQTIILKTAYSLFGILWRKLAKNIPPPFTSL
ncbi:CinA family nicotinamide mononucleotide deamidase-related protein [Candidatus Rhabdochlamydia sp. T3358]|uniref:CinA family nicotinamide mononucleotide deamidase-related protein n=1 Tax=Candidatus Rhabdochlamydia sp. T3358 TaxID=2099795 RepID=UPI0010BB49A5|nr:CinA family nicotinamide mononucleotide deamidase-related protein [Candidatus Rhabdochlamydia sp. T3358]VHO00901.1 Putative competence-damage inducible protein [Candidatus Rhabdochlamydia sp. T3358]